MIQLPLNVTQDIPEHLVDIQTPFGVTHTDVPEVQTKTSDLITVDESALGQLLVRSLATAGVTVTIVQPAAPVHLTAAELRAQYTDAELLAALQALKQ